MYACAPVYSAVTSDAELAANMELHKVSPELPQESGSDSAFPHIKAFRETRDIEQASWPGLHTSSAPSFTGAAQNCCCNSSSQVAAGTRASFKVQAAALWRKNSVYQRRNVASNTCLLGAPIVFCLVLLVIQVAINKLLLSGESYRCGCQCTKCCYEEDSSNCTVQTMAPCPYACLAHNNSNCGVMFSLPTQLPFCDINHTSSWPPVLHAPPEAQRALPHRPNVAMLFTGSLALSQGMISQPGLTAGNLLSVQQYLDTFSSELKPELGSMTVPGELLSLLNLRLGTSSPIKAGLYLETALVGDRTTLYTLWPDGTCKDLGLSGQVNTSLTDMLKAMVTASNTPAMAAVLNQRLDNLTEMLAGNTTTAAAAQVGSIKINCTDVSVSEMSDSAALQQALYCGYYQARCGGAREGSGYAAAVDWKHTHKDSFAPDLYYNGTYGAPADDINSAKSIYQRMPELLNMAVNSWLKTTWGSNYSAELIGVMDTPRRGIAINMDFSTMLGPIFATWVMHMLLPNFLMQLVYEKPLRMMMKMHGLQDNAYKIVMYCWFLLLYITYMMVFVGFGSIIGLNIFTRNDYGVQIAFYFIFGNNMVALAFFLSCFFTNSKTATVFAYVMVFAAGLIGSMLLAQIVSESRWYTPLVELLPSLACFRCLFEMGEYAALATYRESFGMTRANLYDANNGMITDWIILAGEWVVFMVLAWYLEQVYASGTGVTRHPPFFLDWLLKCKQNKKPAPRGPRSTNELHLPTIQSSVKAPLEGSKALAAKAAGTIGAALGVMKTPLSVVDAAAHTAAATTDSEPADVAAERMRVQGLTDYVNHPIVVRALNKTYPTRDGQPPKLAVRTLDLGIHKGECFGLLGPNGAGKSTSISMLVGLLEPSAGTALIGGYDITKDMDTIYSTMGVCPQHDRLWETLTGREHLEFYGRLKGLEGAELDKAIETSLRSVNLWNVANKQAGRYSGGMKRRLSVAISFTGNPLVVYLDEPSTGLDPASRRTLWGAVKANKPDRSIILTTHSMEEAELLCDRLGIFVDGRLVCVGHPKEITSRYGGFMTLTMTVPVDQVAAAQKVVLSMSPTAQLTYSVGGTLKYELKTNEISMSRVFATMSGSTPGLDLLDWSVANCTLEEVFIRFARKIGVKAG